MNLLGVDPREFVPPSNGETFTTPGKFNFYHYKCDGFDDTGWGCGYRTLQSMCSWILENYKEQSDMPVPSIPQIQKTLVDIGDKPRSFLNSKEWLGSVEVSFVIDSLFDISCRILHVDSGRSMKYEIDSLHNHFDRGGCLLMIGGDADCSSKGIAGVHIDNEHTYLLIVDPHFKGNAKSHSLLKSKGWIEWRPLEELSDTSFYNISMPLAYRTDRK